MRDNEIMRYVHIGRILGTAAILWVTWHHTHWSVALSLTLMAVNNEIAAYVLRKIAEAAKWSKVG